MAPGRAVIAIGGNSLIPDADHVTVQDQYRAAGETDDHIAQLIRSGWDVAITHGNGPQVGYILRRSELSAHELHEVPLHVCGADSQGSIGYALQQNLFNDFRQLGIDKSVVTVVTQVEVSADDPAWAAPSKPIGSFMAADQAEQRRVDEGWDVVEDAGRGWRRVVPSPRPIRIIEEPAIRSLLEAGIVVITAGGGGIPVVRDADGDLVGADAVIDKDHASALLANVIDADLFLISTAIEKVALHFGTPQQEWIDQMTVAEARELLADGVHFGAGSMAPKIEAAIDFLEGGGREVVITSPANLEWAVAGDTGTRIVP
jgi:carbamate kinase